ncbi:hypothetical protein K3U93_20440 [Mycobacterium malmoense]|uniref:PE-PGRS family protein n=1 Tax=Mycobacterium malmoense TaxID=1780 RepID=A0ABX3SLX4_MYCMA|nr:hypothetical protein [Mycobacterium malmoense]ORA78793.1 hypothetical protein BST29_20685 [Mycobacterium malmoense]QZA16955.1 hypothetical protein K3U93_20440 [Mycobacterium malmoense]UNB93748.1 hypothetical protein H5T25_20415 [Mycobacterium malmoense]
MIALAPAVSNNLAVDIQHGTATIQQRAVGLTDYVANPIQTWIDTFQTLGYNLQQLGSQFQQYPFPLAQQVAANFAQYAVEYVQPYQEAGNAAVNYLLGTGPDTLAGGLQTAFSDAASGNIAGATEQLVSTLVQEPLQQIGQPMETIPQILNPITQNFATTTAYLTTTAITEYGVVLVIYMPSQFGSVLGEALQNVYNSFTAGDPVGGVINAIDVPGEVANVLLNGLPRTPGQYYGGLFSNNAGIAESTIYLTQGLAGKIAAPNAQDIMSGGSLSYGLGYFGNVLATGFPTPQTTFDTLVNSIQTYLGGFSGAAAAISPAASSIAAAFDSADLFKAFDPAMVTNIAASLGPSLAADVAGSLGSSLGANLAGSLATTLPVDLSMMALHILSAL